MSHPHGGHGSVNDERWTDMQARRIREHGGRRSATATRQVGDYLLTAHITSSDEKFLPELPV